jgi:polar amino acid transport system substrate-binding protein
MGGIRLGVVIVLLALLRPLTCTAATPLRLCTDPDNLPFSSSTKTTDPGIYVELGREIARSLGRPFEAVWVPTETAAREIHETLLAGRCDGFIGVPDSPDFMPSPLILSKPLLTVGYALVAPRGLTVRRLADLYRKRVAVQFSTPPQDLLAEHDEITMVTVDSPREGLDDLATGTADAAILWGPSVEWIDHTTNRTDLYRVVPLADSNMHWQAVIAFAPDQTKLRDSVDRVLGDLGRSITSLKEKYGLCETAPMQFEQVSTKDPAGTPTGAVASPGAHASASSAKIAAGHQLFNDNCEHCHGPDAVVGIEERNLRHLGMRYGAGMDQVFFYTVAHGRPSKGMPNWSGILNNAQFARILAYLHSIQEK